ncbi:MAG: BTAD domain-containing putative transcriptional regulator, partial [Clostridia bacterium]
MTEKTDVRIRMLGGFSLLVNNESKDELIIKSKKGKSLLQYLILKHDAAVTNFKLIEALWPNEESANPENALKTLVSRFRAILNQCSPGLGTCIRASRGGYQFHQIAGLSVDVFDFEACTQQLEGLNVLTQDKMELYHKAIDLYAGDLLAGSDQDDWVIGMCVGLHGRYMKIVYAYLNELKLQEKYNEIIQTCRLALENYVFDEHFHIELMQALVKTNRSNEALLQYKHVTNIHFRYLGVRPPEGIQQFYKHIVMAGDTLEMSLDAVRNELKEYGEVHGAFECEYAVFREIYNLQMRNLERLGSGMYIAMTMISSMDGEAINALKLDDIMNGLAGVLKAHLRKGDTFTHFSPSQYALLLPSVNANSGRIVM